MKNEEIMSKTIQSNGRIHPLMWMLFGALTIIVVACIGVYFAVSSGMVPANADSEPSALEHWMARTSLDATIKKQAGSLADPLPADGATLSAGMKLYSQNCMVCHGASDGKPSNIAVGLYQHAPELGWHGVEDDPEGETYWKVAHGIRLTGMPSFDHTLSETQIWQLATFLKHMDSLPPVVAKAWKKLPSQLGSGVKLPKGPFGPPGSFGRHGQGGSQGPPGPPGTNG
jgi:thiosulfate dehydrogenase